MVLAESLGCRLIATLGVRFLPDESVSRCTPILVPLLRPEKDSMQKYERLVRVCYAATMSMLEVCAWTRVLSSWDYSMCMYRGAAGALGFTD